MNQLVIDIPMEIVWRWEEMISLVAEMMVIPTALIMRVKPPEISVFVASKSPENPFESGTKASLNTGLYCEAVIESGQPLLVSNALQDEQWRYNPDIGLGMISYLGFPVTWPDGSIFGTICVLDRQPNDFSEKDQYFLRNFRDEVEADLRLLAMRDARQRGALAQLDDQQWQSLKTESSDELIGEVAHEFNNILTVIECHASLIRLSGDASPAVQSSVSEILNATGRASALARQLLTSNPETGLKIRPIDLKEVIENTVRMFRQTLSDSIELRVKTTANLPKIPADADLIGQVLLKLIINARDAMPEGGKLTISTRLVRPEEEVIKDENGDWAAGVELLISDNGRGIPAEQIPQIFQPFYTVENADPESDLGLTTVSSIISEHRGRIGVKSVFGRGTTFQIFFPLAEKWSETSKPIEPEAASSGCGATILVVEDDLSVRMLMVCFLKESGYSVLEADTGTQALAIFEKHQSEIDVLLTDIELPDGISGKQLWDQLQPRAPRLGAIFISGYNPLTVGMNQAAGDEWQFLQKPFSPPVLDAAIQQSLEARHRREISGV